VVVALRLVVMVEKVAVVTVVPVLEVVMGEGLEQAVGRAAEPELAALVEVLGAVLGVVKVVEVQVALEVVVEPLTVALPNIMRRHPKAIILNSSQA
jgi:hypothetical protein